MGHTQVVAPQTRGPAQERSRARSCGPARRLEGLVKGLYQGPVTTPETYSYASRASLMHLLSLLLHALSIGSSAKAPRSNGDALGFPP
jgi:hypothetical protein